MLPTEIERKFIIKYLPKNIKQILKITQKHIYKDMVCSIRVRRSEDIKTNRKIYTHTIKAKGKNIQKYSVTELEKQISEEEFKKVRPFKGSNTIEKYRCIIPIENGLKAEVDIFTQKLRGLIIVEVEFKNLEQAKNFQMPEWFLKEVPHKDFSNRKLSTKTREEVLNLVGNEQLKINERIYKELKARLQ